MRMDSFLVRVCPLVLLGDSISVLELVEDDMHKTSDGNCEV